MEGLKNALKDPALLRNLVRAKIDSLGQQWDQLSHLADETNKTGVSKYYMIIGGFGADMVGLRQLVGAFDGADPYTLEKFSTAERILNGVLGGVQLVTTVMGISAFASRMVSACGSFRWLNCFTGYTLIELPPELLTHTAMVVGPPATDTDSQTAWFGAAVGLGLSGVAATYLLCQVERQHRERRQQQRQQQQTLDDLFAGDLVGDLLLPAF